MKNNFCLPQRHSIRLRNYDYTQCGAFFITICTHNRKLLYGEVIAGAMKCNALGEIAKYCWEQIPIHFPLVALDEFVVMPNHIHGIIFINSKPHCVGAQHAAPAAVFCNITGESLGAIVRSYKSAVTKFINKIHGVIGVPIWQRNYYEHVIRNENEMNGIREYIVNNPLQWSFDKENPDYMKLNSQLSDLI